MVSSISTFRGKQRLILVGLIFIIGILYFTGFDQLVDFNEESDNLQYQYNCHITRSLASSPEEELDTNINLTEVVRHHNYLNLNNLNSTVHGKQSREHILVLTTLQNDDKYLDNYFNLLDGSTYPNGLISIGLLVSDSTDNTLENLHARVGKLQARWRNRFYNIGVYEKDFELDSKVDDTSLHSRRATLARSRNFLLTTALKEYHSWVVWVDVKLHSYPKTIFEDLMKTDSDVVVPNCLQHRRDDNEFWAYDRNNWQETDHSLKQQQYYSDDQVLMEDYNEYSAGRTLLVDMSINVGKDYKVPLDAVGTTFTMVKATVHREGAVFPPYLYQHMYDSEGFAKMVKAMGFYVYGLPSYIIYHY